MDYVEETVVVEDYPIGGGFGFDGFGGGYGGGVVTEVVDYGPGFGGIGYGGPAVVPGCCCSLI